MNYEELINKIIIKRKFLGIPSGYKEEHHIIPKSFGGSNEPENLIYLTAREHFVVHRCLAKLYPNSGMVHAVYLMACTGREKYKVTSRVYEALRLAHANRISNNKESSLKKSKKLKGRKQNKEHIENRVKSRKNNNKKWHSEETRNKISSSNKGQICYWKNKKIPKEFIEKRNLSRKNNNNYKWTKEQRLKQSISRKGKPSNRIFTDKHRKELSIEKSKKIECPHCRKLGQMMVMHRWHFNKCKQKLK